MIRLRYVFLFLLLSLSISMHAQYKRDLYFEDFSRFVPAAVDMALPLSGVKAENPFIDRAIAFGIGFVSECMIVKGMKMIVSEERPDGSDTTSFPSGHSATAFLGAECVRHEYGWGWGAGAYAVATSVAVMRVCHNRHYWWDTVAGAGAGILSANIGYWLLSPTKNILGIHTKSDVRLTMNPVVDPYSGTLCTSLSLTF